MSAQYAPGCGGNHENRPAGAAPHAASGSDPTVAVVQALLDAMPGTVSLISPVRDAAGELVDWRIDAITRDTGDLGGHGATEMIGRRLLELYPGLRDSTHLAAYRRVLATGAGEDLGPFRYEQASAVLDAGDLLLMYTDGLVESASTSLEEGLSALTDTVLASMRSPGDPLTTMIRRLRRTNPNDDTCILAAQLTA